ncbi:MAG TPA: ATP-binding protein [Gemmatimonadaceae bacterium]|nr:ATP-binding protein [Gemmatimonadaceae bacterium]
MSAFGATARGVRRREWLIWFSVFAAATLVLFVGRRRLNETYIALAYLLVVQAGSARGGRPLGIALATVAFVCFDYFFLPPFGTLALADPLNWVVLGAFFATSIVSAQLLYRARAEAARAALLQDAHRTKDAVLASVSHDLRTPLTTIKALASEIAAGGDDRAATIEEEADRLNAFVTQMLDLSRIETGTAALQVQPNEAEDLLGAVAQQVAGGLADHELRIAVEPVDGLLFGRFDFTQTLRSLTNLIENAAKYSPPGAPIDLRASRDGPWLAFTVADRGPGIPEAERERIFEPFYRRASVAPDAGGAGLGLSIARGIAEAQGGSVTVSAREGGGSVFALRVPYVAIELRHVADKMS